MSPRAQVSDQPHHLAGGDRQVDIFEGRAVAKARNVKYGLAAARRASLPGPADIPADHEPAEFLDGGVTDRSPGDQAPVAHHARPIRDGDHLVEIVRHENEFLAATPQRREDLEEAILILLAEPRRGLVEDHHVALQGQNAGDLRDLLRPCRQRSHLGVGVEPEAVLIQDALGGDAERRPVDPAPQRTRCAELQVLDAEEDVFGHRHLGDEVELLVHDPDAGQERGLGAAEVDRAAVDCGCTPRVGILSAQHFDQRRLAGAIGAEERMDLAGFDLEIDAVQNRDAGELLMDRLHLQHARHLRTRVASCPPSELNPTARSRIAPVTPVCRKGETL